MKIKQANKQLKKVMFYLRANESAFESMDLKIHDVSYYLYSDFEKDFPGLTESDGENAFNSFCECEYDSMIEYFAENNIEWNPRHVGRTSAFYLSDKVDFIQKRNYYYGIDFQCTIENLLNCLGYTADCMPDITPRGLIDTDDPYLKDCECNINYIASGEFFKDVKNELQGVLFMYDYIKAFKENQIDNFKDFVECNYIDPLESENNDAAHRIGDALRNFAKNPGAIDNFESYLTRHFHKWAQTYGKNADGFISELEQFSTIV